MDQPNDLLKARVEAALLLRLDPENLSAADVLRCDLIASLRLVVDDASTSVLDGRAPDLARLLTATESLIKLLPTEPPKPASSRPDPREAMWKTYLEMRRRGEIADQLAGPKYSLPAAQRRIGELEAELAALKAGASPVPGSTAITPPDSDIVPPGEQGVTYRGGPSRGPDHPPAPSTAVIEH